MVKWSLKIQYLWHLNDNALEDKINLFQKDVYTLNGFNIWCHFSLRQDSQVHISSRRNGNLLFPREKNSKTLLPGSVTLCFSGRVICFRGRNFHTRRHSNVLINLEVMNAIWSYWGNYSSESKGKRRNNGFHQKSKRVPEKHLFPL